eukprot:scaffold12024_cov63-Phaeocystis_antarctica.AAC.3
MAREALAAHRASFWSKCLNWVPRGEKRCDRACVGRHRGPPVLLRRQLSQVIHDEDSVQRCW